MSDSNRASPYSKSAKPNQEGEMDFDAKRNLIVNYLPHTLNQDDVKMLFCRVGPVTNCKLIHNYETGQSLGYAFIEYPSEKLAEEAIVQIDGIQIQEKTLKVSYARQSSPEIKNSNVYVAGLPSFITEEKLLSLFSPFGDIITHKLLYNPDNSCRGVGFVRYSLKSSAENSIQTMNGKPLEGGNVLTVKLAIPPASKQHNAMMNNGQANVSISATSMNRSSIRYNPLGSSTQIISNQLPHGQTQLMNQHQLEPASPFASGFLPTPIPMSRASNILGQQDITPQQQSPEKQMFSIYVYGLQPTHSELNLYELFSPFGGILNVKLIRDLTKDEQPCKGFGFVNYCKYDDAYRAVLTMNNYQFDGKNLQVSFKQNKNGTPQHISNSIPVSGNLYTPPASINHMK